MIWCAEHGAALSPDEGRQSQICWVARYGTWDFKRCEFVEALLIVKEKKGWPAWALTQLSFGLKPDETLGLLLAASKTEKEQEELYGRPSPPTI